MQPLLIGPRATLTEQAIIELIQRDSGIRVGGGLELIDRGLNVLANLSNNLEGGEVSRTSYATIHGSCTLAINTQLSWGSAIVRPYILIESDKHPQTRFNLGAYFTNTPEHVTGVDPVTYAVTGYDILDALDNPVGDSFALAAGTSYLAAVENILESQGYSKFSIDPLRADTTLPNARGWPMSDNVTWLIIINDLLSAIGYRGVYSDWDGFIVCEPYSPPEDRAVEWVYDDGMYTSQLGPQQTVAHDYYKTPNTWIGVRSNIAEGESPTEGNGIFTYQNLYTGETSVESRQRVVAKRLDIEAADQAALEAAVKRQASADMSVGTYITAETTPNPLHWHFDVVGVATRELGSLRVLCTEWRLPLTGGMMTHNWAVI